MTKFSVAVSIFGASVMRLFQSRWNKLLSLSKSASLYIHTLRGYARLVLYFIVIDKNVASPRFSPAFKVSDSVTFMFCVVKIGSMSVRLEFVILVASLILLMRWQSNIISYMICVSNQRFIILSDNSHALSKDHEKFLQNEESAFGGRYTQHKKIWEVGSSISNQTNSTLAGSRSLRLLHDS